MTSRFPIQAPSLRTSAILAVAIAGVTCVPAALAVDPAGADLVERGRYLVTVGDCNGCHTPLKMGANGPEPDMTRMLSGHPESLQMPPVSLPARPWEFVGSGTTTAWSGPWGTSFTANLTPDAETGLGKWTLQNFRDTLRTGKRMGRGREILPPMPIPAYRHFTDADIEAIYSYLQSIPAISNRVPQPLPPPDAPSAD
jgi:mono/diheme cytochrome c family protein